jgi:putative FmdB family regulatory protein
LTLPVYVYRCADCGSQFETKQSFSEAPLSECESCGGRLRKVFQPTTVIYKGSGFYSTDHSSKSRGNGRIGDSEKEDRGREESAKPASDPSKDSAVPATDSSKDSAKPSGTSIKDAARTAVTSSQG